MQDLCGYKGGRRKNGRRTTFQRRIPGVGTRSQRRYRASEKKAHPGADLKVCLINMVKSVAEGSKTFAVHRGKRGIWFLCGVSKGLDKA